MDSIGQIGLVMPEITDPLDYELLGGVYDQAKLLGFDVVVFTGVLNSLSDDDRNYYTGGFENIYSLICKSRLDGLIFAAGRFRSQEAVKDILDYIAQTNIPVLALEYEHESIPCLNAKQHEGAYAMTSHLIEVHGCKNVWCIAGFPDHKPSLERLQGYLDAMRDHGLTVDENCVHFGHYWRDIPENIARKIASGELPCPEGVVCLSDTMAIYFGDELFRNGIDVPGKVRITGYDGMWYSALHDPITTTVCGRDRQLGEDAVCRLYEMFTGQKPVCAGSRQTVRIGTSCGCNYNNIASYDKIIRPLEKHMAHQLFRGFERKSYLGTDLISKLSDAEDVQGLMDEVSACAHMLHGWEWLDIALCEDWQSDKDNPYSFRQQSFSDRMLLALSKRHGGNEKSSGYFPASDILPALRSPHEPLIAVLTCLHCKGQIFGYSAIAYKSPDDIELDEYFVHWTDAVSSGLHALQRRLYVNYIHQQMEAFSTTDTMTGLLNCRGFTEKLPDTLHKLRTAGENYSLLLISWLNDTAAYDTAVVLANSIKSAADGHLSGRLSECVFAVLLTGEENSTQLTDALEAELSSALGNPALIPELFTEVCGISGTLPAEIEKSVSDCMKSFTQKRNDEISRNSTYRELLYTLRRDIMSKPGNDWNIPDISRDLGISKSHLQRLYREMFSTSVKDDIILSRMNRAMQLLAHTEMRVHEIAEQCGYNNENHFMRQFKKKNGVTALQYRKNYQ